MPLNTKNQNQEDRGLKCERWNIFLKGSLETL